MSIIIVGNEAQAVVHSGSENPILKTRCIRSIPTKCHREIILISSFREKIFAKTSNVPISITSSGNPVEIPFEIMEKQHQPYLLNSHAYNINKCLVSFGPKLQILRHSPFSCEKEDGTASWKNLIVSSSVQERAL
ncbi:hypothetical protein NPIL_528571 [Nephila pilipes]|uniref:Uncharacterized protein n=1 Tax=Nephila pilipes TaxID=299642 RepID=A0A8X6UKS8_NEPPI|nr:hypothetical protein NPIL_528571 [Nephila pilipes]